MEGLEERDRSGRSRLFPPELVIAVKAIACELPAQLGLPLSRLQVPDIQAEVINRGLVASISGSTIWQRLLEDATPGLGAIRDGSSPATPTSAPRPVGSSISTPASSKTNDSAPAST